jgi:hypothetical protein
MGDEPDAGGESEEGEHARGRRAVVGRADVVDQAHGQDAEQRDLSRLSDLLAKRPELATMEMDHWLDHPLGAAPLSYVAMQRYDTKGNLWRRVPGTGALARALLAAGTQHDRVEAILAPQTT